jgi:hypothetical protein
MSKLPVREVTGVTSNGITPGLIYTQLVSPARATKGHRCRGLLQPQSAERLHDGDTLSHRRRRHAVGLTFLEEIRKAAKA